MNFKTLEALAIALLGNQLSVDDFQVAMKGLNSRQRLQLFEQLEELQETPDRVERHA
jgi:hypothetical protein